LAFASAPTGSPNSDSSDGSTVTKAQPTAEELFQHKILNGPESETEDEIETSTTTK
jgi:hypothetical protein